MYLGPCSWQKSRKKSEFVVISCLLLISKLIWHFGTRFWQKSRPFRCLGGLLIRISKLKNVLRPMIFLAKKSEKKLIGRDFLPFFSLILLISKLMRPFGTCFWQKGRLILFLIGFGWNLVWSRLKARNEEKKPFEPIIFLIFTENGDQKENGKKYKNDFTNSNAKVDEWHSGSKKYGKTSVLNVQTIVKVVFS